MFTLEGEFVKLVGSAGKKGNGRLQFYHPQGIMVHPSSGKVFIADTCNHRIQVLNSDLTYSHEFGSRGDDDGQFNQPYGIACGTNGDVYVTDHFNHRVQVFTASGQFTIPAHLSNPSLCGTHQVLLLTCWVQCMSVTIKIYRYLTARDSL